MSYKGNQKNMKKFIENIYIWSLSFAVFLSALIWPQIVFLNANIKNLASPLFSGFNEIISFMSIL